jgi:hypothetical protein
MNLPSPDGVHPDACATAAVRCASSGMAARTWTLAAEPACSLTMGASTNLLIRSDSRFSVTSATLLPRAPRYEENILHPLCQPPLQSEGTVEVMSACPAVAAPPNAKTRAPMLINLGSLRELHVSALADRTMTRAGW